jgi:hypothetical protein
MKLSHPRLAAILAVVAVAAAAFLAIGSLPGGERSAAPGARAMTEARTTGTGPPVIVGCGNNDQVRPATFTLSCADGGVGLTRMHWLTWQSSARGTGMTWVNDCDPYCATGKFYYLPTLVVLRRPEPLPRRPGVLYFTRMTWIYTGQHCVPSPKDKRSCFPVTGTQDLKSNLP